MLCNLDSFDGGREGKLWTITKGMLHFLDFAASILMEVNASTSFSTSKLIILRSATVLQAHSCANSRSVALPKKQKKDDVFDTLTEHLIKGNSLW